jgi:hypothetical protein
MNSIKTRKDLPQVARLIFSVNIDLIINELKAQGLLNIENYNDFDYSDKSPIKNLLGKNLDVRKSAMNQSELKRAAETNQYVSQSYRQYSLTESVLIKSTKLENEIPLTAKDRLKRLNRNSYLYDPDVDERNYGKIKESIGPVLRQLLQSFPGKLCRARLAALMPRESISRHRDYDPSYLVRIHIPILTNSKSFIFFENKGVTYRYNCQADGGAYFLNAGLIHWVENQGDSPRIHLLVDIDGQEALKNMVEMDAQA